MIKGSHIAIIVSLLLVGGLLPQPAGAAGSDPRAKRHDLLDEHGNVVSHATVIPHFQILTAPGAVQPAVATPPNYQIPAASAPQALSDDEVSSILTELFNWGSANRYAAYLLALPGNISDIKSLVASTVKAQQAGSVVQYPPYTNVNNPRAVFKIQIQTALQGQPAFNGASGSGDADDADFIYLDGINQPVPYGVFYSFEASFINGLVTRLILGQYAQMWKQVDGAFQMKNLDILTQLPGTLQFPTLTANGLYQTPNWASTIDSMLLNNPVQPLGIIWGWRCAAELDEAPSGDAKYRGDVWKLVQSRFTSYDKGRMVAFTLNYLNGFIKNQRIATLAADAHAADPNPTPLAIGDIAKQFTNLVANDLNSNKNSAASKTLLTLFHSSLVSQFYALSQNSTAPDKNDGLGRISNMLLGFEAGSVDAADLVYLQVFDLAYGLGLSDGYRDGYSMGYEAGYKIGYAAGYQQAWSEANAVISKLQAQLDDDSIWSTIGTIATTVGNIATTVTSVADAATAVIAVF